MILYAGTSGGLDEFPTRRVQEFEEAYLRFVRGGPSGILEEIRTTNQLSVESKSTLKQAVTTVQSEPVTTAAPASTQEELEKNP